MTPQQFALALAICESQNDDRAYGDDGLALTAWQVHPAWVYDRMHTRNIIPQVRESWRSWVMRMVEDFFEVRSSSLDPLHIAMTFHLGHQATEDAPDWDRAYAARFVAATERVLGSSS